MARGRIIYGQSRRFFVDDREVTQAEFDEAFPSRPIGQLLKVEPNALMETSKAWPRMSDALGVGKGQKQKAEEVFAKKGVPTEFVPDGSGGYSAVIRNNAHQRDVLKAMGMHNNDAGYGQVTG